MKVIHNCDLTRFNSYNIPARCRIAYFPESAADLAEIFRSHLSHTKPIILGSGHNIVLAREHYETPFIIFHGNLSKIEVRNETITIEAGAFTQAVCEFALAHSLAGFELFYDIPSSMGGAIVMNAGYPEEDISGILKTVTYLDTQTHQINTIPKKEAGFHYRNSLFQNDPTKIVISADVQLRKDNPTHIREKMDRIKAERWAKQPREYPNAGSVFKRPNGRYVGPMLDELGLKGHTHRGFRVSPKHSGFIENIEQGSGRDLLALIKDIQGRVYDRFGITLETEQRIIDAP